MVEKSKGKLIVIDGIDGSGKATQTELLVSRMKVAGYAVETISFPRHGELSCKLVDLYLDKDKIFGEPTEVEPKSASGFYAIDRLLNKSKIEKWLKEGRNVIVDRYVSANFGHQGSKISDSEKRAKFFEWDYKLEYERLNLPIPNLIFLLSMPAEIAFELKKMQKEQTGGSMDGHEGNIKYLINTENAFLHAAQIYNWEIIECSDGTKPLPKPIIHKKLWKIVEEFLKQ